MNAENRDKPEYPVGQRIKYFRQQKGISTNKLANMAGVSQSYLRDLELENKKPTVEFIYQICKALELSLCDFFDDKIPTTFYNDPLIEQLYKLNPAQRETLLAFLKTIK